jgi:tetratricopeptide (TPR) repeat protein
MKVFENAPAKVGVVYAGCWRIENGQKMYVPQSWVTKKEGDIHQELLKGGIGFIITCSLVVKKECFKKAGLFDERLPSLEEWDLAIRLSKYYEFRYINEALSISIMKPDSISTNHRAAIKAFELILGKHYEEFKKNDTLLARHQYAIGNLLCQSGDFNQGRGYLFRAVKSYPLNISYLVVALTSLFGQDIYKRILDIYHVISLVRNKHEK